MSSKNQITQLKYSDVAPLREELLKKQGGICLICKRKVERPVLDHHHTKRIKGTGLIRGVICSTCNVLLAKMENNCVRYGVKQADLPFILSQMRRYLLRDHFPYLHPTEAEKKKLLTKSSFNKLVKEMKKQGFKNKFPEYPKSMQLTKPIQALFAKYSVNPEFYK